MPVSLIDHVTVRPVSAWPPASFVVSVSCDDVPTRSVIVPGATTIEATGTGTTVICAGCFGETPDVLASMVTLPSAMPLTTPPCVTVAMVGSLVDQKIGKLLMGLPELLTGWALNVTVDPRTTDVVSGEIRMSSTRRELGPVTSLAHAASSSAAAILPRSRARNR